MGKNRNPYPGRLPRGCSPLSQSRMTMARTSCYPTSGPARTVRFDVRLKAYVGEGRVLLSSNYTAPRSAPLGSSERALRQRKQAST